MSLQLGMLIPIIEVFKEYFDNKYPCTTEENDGNDMPLNDEVKFEVYNFLLSTYNNFKDISVDSYNELLIKINQAK